jgi:hypothetical protein
MATPDNPMQNQKVELGKETRQQILAALKGIKSQLAAARQRESKASDVAADVIASGGSPLDAARESAKFQKDKLVGAFKRKFDPLNIVHRMTGGSKLATVLAGKAMFRSQKSIRSAAGLSPVEEAPLTPTAEPSTPDQPQGATAIGQDSRALFETMSKTLALIALRVTDIAVKMGASKNIKIDKNGRARDINTGRFVADQESKQTEYLKEIVEGVRKETANLDAQKDASVEAAYESKFGTKNTATQVNREGDECGKGKSSGGLFDSVLTWIKEHWATLMTTIGTAITGFTLYLKDKLGAILSWMGDKLGAFTKFIGEGIDTVLEKTGVKGAWEGVKSAAGKVMTGAKSLLGIAPAVAAIPPPIPAKTEPPQKTPSPAKAAGKGASPVPKKGLPEILQKIGPGIVKKGLARAIPFAGAAIGAKFAYDAFKEGDYTQALIDAAAGAASLTGVGGIPAAAVAIGASLANAAYKELYGVDPISDPNAAENMAKIMPSISEYMAEALKPVAANEAPQDDTSGLSTLGQTFTRHNTNTFPPPPKATEVPAAGSTVGTMLNQSADLKASAATPIQPGTGGTNFTKIVNNSPSSTTIHQPIASPRSGESSYMRSIDRDFVPA